MSACRSCGATITWGLTPKGKRMPLDPFPSPDGNVIATGTALVDGRQTMTVAVLARGEPKPPDAVAYHSHFETCPNSAAHRKRRR